MVNTYVSIASWVAIIPDTVFEPDAFEPGWNLYETLKSIVIHTLPLIETTLNLFFFYDVTAYVADVWVPILFNIWYWSVSVVFTYIGDLDIYANTTYETDEELITSLLGGIAITSVFQVGNAFISQELRGRSEF